MEKLSRKDKELMDRDNSAVIVEGWRWVEVEEGMRRYMVMGKK